MSNASMPMRQPPMIPPRAPQPPRPAARSGDDNATASAFLDATVLRLQALLDEETAALRARKPVDLKSFNNGKSQALFDLNRAMRLLNGASPDERMKARLATLRGKLELNRAVLHMHLEAVREISTIVADAIQDAESDGTYSVTIRSAGKTQ